MKSTFVISIYRNIYECPSNGPKHMSVAVNKWKYRLQYLNYIGGVTTLSRKLYQVNNSGAGNGGARGATGLPPTFGRSINPILTGEGRLYPPITTGTPNVFHLPASLNKIYFY